MSSVRKIVYDRFEVAECENWSKKIAGERLLTQALKQSGNIAYAWSEAERHCLSRDRKRLDMQGLRLARKIVYARVEAEIMREPKYIKLQRKDCLSTD